MTSVVCYTFLRVKMLIDVVVLLWCRVTVVVDLDKFWVDERSPIIYDFRLTPPTPPPTSTVHAFFSCHHRRHHHLVTTEQKLLHHVMEY